MKTNSSLITFDLEILQNNGAIIGMDEAGRGPLAGPVFAAAVRLDADFYRNRNNFSWLGEINDSKKISPKKREWLFSKLVEVGSIGSLSMTICSADVGEIEQLNIFGATIVAMHRCLENLASHGTPVIVDGNFLKTLKFNHIGIPKGDGKSLVIAMASIAAKVSRDRYMENLDLLYPSYGFARHKGYGTSQHIAAIKTHGLMAEHRSLFVRKIL
ncbi:MAG: ribonuclease HII [Puniceicoccales bacterium]|jgi:ribonuclease HII|nr:ribonuclease HII [Puniceicoccales bacterium]